MSFSGLSRLNWPHAFSSIDRFAIHMAPVAIRSSDCYMLFKPRSVRHGSLDQVYQPTLRFPPLGPPPRKTHFQLLVRRYWTGFPPARFLRKVSKLYLYISFPFPSFAWHNQIHRRTSRDSEPSGGVSRPLATASPHISPVLLRRLKSFRGCVME